MKKRLLIVITFLLGAFTALGQAYVSFETPPKMRLTAQNQYSNYRVKYKALKKSTIYLELKRGNLIVASGVLDVPEASERVSNMTIKVKAPRALQPGNNYSYNLYMYAGGRNDWTKKACKSVRLNGISVAASKGPKKTQNTLSLRNFFN